MYIPKVHHLSLHAYFAGVDPIVPVVIHLGPLDRALVLVSAQHASLLLRQRRTLGGLALADHEAVAVVLDILIENQQQSGWMSDDGAEVE